MRFNSKAERPARLQGLFTQKILDFLGAAEPPTNPSAEGATFRLCAVCGDSLGLFLIKNPKKLQHKLWDGALCWYCGVCGACVDGYLGGFRVPVPELDTPLLNHLLFSDLQFPKAEFLCQK